MEVWVREIYQVEKGTSVPENLTSKIKALAEKYDTQMYKAVHTENGISGYHRILNAILTEINNMK